ncbi:MAG: hypothetical protein P4L44_11025 [Oryzomonas sp.]|uniref:hypothetical protein n=1 Tax=Oryzomonas sp. TaxID=2855186 RepID=UPI00284FF5E3|nr:hypothetical protein [Oryzomonas sp.]MDR3580484.1 hypothetical protein [Oryzomonas sp.]
MNTRNNIQGAAGGNNATSRSPLYGTIADAANKSGDFISYGEDENILKSFYLLEKMQ